MKLRFLPIALLLVLVALIAFGSIPAFAQGNDFIEPPAVYEDAPGYDGVIPPSTRIYLAKTPEPPAVYVRSDEVGFSGPVVGINDPETESGLRPEEIQLAPVVRPVYDGTIQINSTIPLRIDGVETNRFPAQAGLGSVACIIDPIRYMTESERQVFDHWSDGSTDRCLTVTAPGVYSAVMSTEVLLQVRSEAKAYRRSEWVIRGTPTRLEVPQIIEGEPGVRYLFEEWRGGGETPFKPVNTIAPMRAMNLEVLWKKEFYFELKGPDNIDLMGTGWHPAGQRVVIQATLEVLSADGLTRSRFERWENINGHGVVIPSPGSAATNLIADAPHIIEARYRNEYLVTAMNPNGTFKKQWVKDGDEIVLETPPFMDIVKDQERLAFKKWEGDEMDSHKGFLVVDRPLQMNAIYDTQYMVKVSSPYGASGEGWYTEGELAEISVPGQPGGIVFLKKYFDNFPGYEADGPKLSAPVNGPLTITADYKTQIDIMILTVIVVGITGALLVYLVSQMVLKRREAPQRATRRRRMRRRLA
ncbi:MAG: hypothetical protein IIB11_03090 [Chloroflexi bacterium]|nr:hypothetical protein [Chloroflexota bacterium]